MQVKFILGFSAKALCPLTINLVHRFSIKSFIYLVVGLFCYEFVIIDKKVYVSLPLHSSFTV